MATSHSGAHFQGPILGSDKAGAGLYEDLPLGVVDAVRSPFKVYVENFDTIIADATAFAELGATVTAVGAVAANTLANTAGLRLAINPGTAADTGYEIQFNTASSQATYVNNRFRVLPLIAAGSGSMPAGREIVFFARAGFVSNATSWDGKALLGWFVDDTALLSPTTGLPTVAAGGGVGFHIGEDGVISYVCNDAAITAAGTTITSLGTLTANSNKWLDFGFRMKVTEFSSQTGNVDFYFGPAGSIQKVASTRQSGTLPITNATNYSTSIACLNGPTNLSDLSIESLITAQTKVTAL